MKKQMRDRNTQKPDKEKDYKEMAEHPPDAKAARAFIHKTYTSYSVEEGTK